jgi:hypothetical protein
VKAGRRGAKFEDKMDGREERVQDTSEMLERKEKEHGEEGERKKTTREKDMPVKKWKD